ncbi:MAG: thrombospondin type 3 repeat-containing protein [Gammaproteobacteria bacterium]
MMPEFGGWVGTAARRRPLWVRDHQLAARERKPPCRRYSGSIGGRQLGGCRPEYDRRFGRRWPDRCSSGDGISDGDEVNLYHTNPKSADSDGDGFSDYAEINAGSNPNDPAGAAIIGADHGQGQRVDPIRDLRALPAHHGNMGAVHARVRAWSLVVGIFTLNLLIYWLPGAAPLPRSGVWWFLYNDSLHEVLLQRMGALCYGYM